MTSPKRVRHRAGPIPKYPRDLAAKWLRDLSSPSLDRVLTRLLKAPSLGLKEEHYRQILDAVFFASLAKEEGTPCLVRIVYCKDGITGLRELVDTSSDPQADPEGPQRAWDLIEIEPRPCTPSILAKLAPAVLPDSAFLVDVRGGRICVVGIATRNPNTNGGRSLVISAVGPGAVRVLYQIIEIFRFEQGVSLPPRELVFFKQGPVQKLLHAIDQRLEVVDGSGASAVARLVRRMTMTGKGGIIALLASGEQLDVGTHPLQLVDATALELQMRAERRVLLQAIAAAPTMAFPSKADRERFDSIQREFDLARRRLQDTIDVVGQLTAVDNALVLDANMRVVAFGYPLPAPEMPLPPIFEASTAEARKVSVWDSTKCGSRHRAAFCFASMREGRLAFVASEDGPIKCITKHQGRVVFWNVAPPVSLSG